MTIKAIETEYNGYKFRSRLEARWAVFFDAAGIKYEYESEGFEGYDGTKYLPDFYFPDFDVYGEVKPNNQKLFEDSAKIGCMIDFESSPISKGLILLGPIPYYESNWDKSPFPAHDMLYWSKGVAVKRIRFKMRRHDYPTDLLTVEPCFDGNTAEIPASASVEVTFYDESCSADKDKGLEQYAYKAARQARFEHGETPVIAHD